MCGLRFSVWGWETFQRSHGTFSSQLAKEVLHLPPPLPRPPPPPCITDVCCDHNHRDRYLDQHQHRPLEKSRYKARCFSFIESEKFDPRKSGLSTNDKDHGRGQDLCLRFFEKVRSFTPFDRWSGIRSVSGIRPTCQCRCPPLQIIQRRENLVLYKSLNIRCTNPSQRHQSAATGALYFNIRCTLYFIGSLHLGGVSLMKTLSMFSLECI